MLEAIFPNPCPINSWFASSFCFVCDAIDLETAYASKKPTMPIIKALGNSVKTSFVERLGIAGRLNLAFISPITTTSLASKSKKYESKIPIVMTINADGKAFENSFLKKISKRTLNIPTNIVNKCKLGIDLMISKKFKKTNS